MLRNEAGGIKGRVPYIALGICDVSTEFGQLKKRKIISTSPKSQSGQFIVRVQYLKDRIWVLGFVTIDFYNVVVFLFVCLFVVGFFGGVFFDVIKNSKVILIPDMTRYIGITLGIIMEKKLLCSSSRVRMDKQKGFSTAKVPWAPLKV